MTNEVKSYPIAKVIDGAVWYNEAAYDRIDAELADANAEVARLKEAGRKLIPAYGGAESLADVHCSYRRDIAHALGQVEFYRDSWDDLVAKVAALAKAEGVGGTTWCWLGALPAVDSPGGLRYAADVIESTSAPDTPFPELQKRQPIELRAEADRLEREQAEKAKRDKVIELLFHGTSIADITAVLDRFDITPKVTDE